MSLRLMTYNIRHGRGLDGRVELSRIADVIASQSPDVVTLQEVDYGRCRSGIVDQADVLACKLGMDARFAACMEHDEDGHYGIATLTRLPLMSSEQVCLPHSGEKRRFSEPRSALVTRLMWGGGELDLVNTHLSLRPAERAKQAVALVELGHEHDTILAGDLNCTPLSWAYRHLLKRLHGVHISEASWPSRWPILRLDHMLYRGQLMHSEAKVVGDKLAKQASDHLPIIARFEPHGNGAGR